MEKKRRAHMISRTKSIESPAIMYDITQLVRVANKTIKIMMLFYET